MARQSPPAPAPVAPEHIAGVQPRGFLIVPAVPPRYPGNPLSPEME
ncbi:hypothetical protein GCM10017687_16000 [Streptomyces echinatus]|uniref:Uncharacterized protein n=1 Tax=Streptomyces echinatus TaxID=67293 RepID=A0A7W9PNA2_9ACTN|nr:hypothetical protein [Streptomyces echinatus]